MLEIGPGALQVLATDSLGELQQGSATISSDQPLSGVIVFSGASIGAAGVGSSQELAEGFVAPIQTDEEAGLDTGVGVMNLEDFTLTIEAELLSSDGGAIATAQITVPALGHQALFVTQIEWDREVDFSEFEGVIQFQANGRHAATVIQTRPGQFATQPVAAKPQ